MTFELRGNVSGQVLTEAPILSQFLAKYHTVWVGKGTFPHFILNHIYNSFLIFKRGPKVFRILQPFSSATVGELEVREGWEMTTFLENVSLRIMELNSYLCMQKIQHLQDTHL